MTDFIEETSSTTGFGLRLKTARESYRLSEKEAALRLHLNPSIISILENEDFENGPPLIFIRGYFRSYARLLNFNDKEIQVALEQFKIQSELTPVVVSENLTEKHYSSERYLHWITYLIVSLLTVLVGIWWNSHSREKTHRHTALQQAATQIIVQPPIVQPSIAQPTTTQSVAPTVAVATTPPQQPALANSTIPVQNKPNPPVSTVSTHHTAEEDADMAVALPEPGLEPN